MANQQAQPPPADLQKEGEYESPFFSFYHIAGPPFAGFQPPSVFKDSVRLQEPTKGGPYAAKQTTAFSITSKAPAGQFPDRLRRSEAWNG
jgi:hypothetical protein